MRLVQEIIAERRVFIVEVDQAPLEEIQVQLCCTVGPISFRHNR
jgi:hypothetical protein